MFSGSCSSQRFCIGISSVACLCLIFALFSSDSLCVLTFFSSNGLLTTAGAEKSDTLGLADRRTEYSLPYLKELATLMRVHTYLKMPFFSQIPVEPPHHSQGDSSCLSTFHNTRKSATPVYLTLSLATSYRSLMQYQTSPFAIMPRTQDL